MKCPSILTRTRFADGMLSGDDADTVKRHVAGCADCRASVDDLVAERRALRAALRAAETNDVVPDFAPGFDRRLPFLRLFSWFSWTVAAVWAVNLARAALTPLGLPRWLGWLIPDAADVGIGMAVDVVTEFALGGGGSLADFLGSIAWIVLAVVGVGGCAFLLRRYVRGAAAACVSLGLIGVLMIAAAPSQAFEIRRGDERVIVSPAETIDDTLVLMSDNVVFEGTVTGDLIVFGERVSIRGHVGGMVIAAAESLSMEGDFAGNVVGVGETVDLRDASSNGNLYAAGETVTVHAGTEFAGNAVLAANEAEMHGVVARDLIAMTQHFSLFGAVNRNVQVYAEDADVVDGAHVGGDLTGRVASPGGLRVADRATVDGRTDVSAWPEEPSRYVTVQYYVGEMLKFLAAFLTGLVLLYFFPALRRTRMDNGAEVLTVMGLGALALVATPVLAAVAVFTLIGAPLGFAAILLWLVGLYSAGIVVAGHAGRVLLEDDSRGGALQLLLGLTILFVLINIPFIGGVVRLVVVVAGLGLIVRWLRDRSVAEPA